MRLIKYLLVIVLCLVFFTSCSREPEDFSIPITIINNTGVNPFVISIRRPDTTFWEAWVRSSAASTELQVTIPFQFMSIENRMDIMLQANSSTPSVIYIKLSQIIKPDVVITFTSDDAY